MKCKFCTVELISEKTYPPFSMNDLVGGEKEPIDEYLYCPKCGLMYKPIKE